MSLALTSILSSLVLTYAVSRLALMLVRGLPGMAAPIAAHALSLGVLMALVAYTKSYAGFPLAETFVLILPQLLWLLVDLVIGDWRPARR